MSKLTLEPQSCTRNGNDDERVMRFHFYDSSVLTEDAKPLLTMTSRKAGMRLTEDQVIELRDYLDTWLGINGDIGR